MNKILKDDLREIMVSVKWGETSIKEGLKDIEEVLADDLERRKKVRRRLKNPKKSLSQIISEL